jgi:hypothetical protein
LPHCGAELAFNLFNLDTNRLVVLLSKILG